MSYTNIVLKYLQLNHDYISGEELSRHLNISRTTVWKNINMLREWGYEIQSVTNKGYKLISCPDTINPNEVAADLGTELIGKKIYTYTSIDSTNAQAKREALQGAASGSVFLAEEQLSGKGRLGRTWSSPPSTGLWFSILLRSSLLPLQITNITLLTGLAVCRAIRSYTGLPAFIKWPNDIVINSKKVCGILTEIAAEVDRIEYIVVGIGINVNNASFPQELAVKATSLRIQQNTPISRVGLLQEILRTFDKVIIESKTNSDALLNDYRSLCISLNRKVEFTRNHQTLYGTAVDISPLGELVVSCEDGTAIPINSGEVTVQGIYGQ